jgi:hypothetical protein
MPPLLRCLVVAAALLLSAPSARAVSIVTLQLDPELSVLIPEIGAAQSLSGSITVEVADLPLGAPTTFDVIGLDLTLSGGATIGLDPAIVDPGLGVLSPPGEFLIPTLFLRLDDGTPEDFSIPDVTGSVLFGDGGTTLIQLDTSFEIDTGEVAGLLMVNVRAVPEPGTTALLTVGFAALAALRARPEVAR